MKEIEVSRENQRPLASYWQTLSHNVVSSKPRQERGFELNTLVVICIDCTDSCQSNYHTIMITTVPTLLHANHVTCTYCVQAVGQRSVKAAPTPEAVNADPHAETHAACPIPEWANFSTCSITWCRSGTWIWRLPTKIKIRLH